MAANAREAIDCARARAQKPSCMRRLFLLALRNVMRNRRRTWVTLAALVVGVGGAVCVRGLLDGLQNATVETVVLGQTGAIQIHRKGYLENVLASPLNLTVPADEAFLAKLRAVPGVTAVAARISFPGLVSVGEETLFMAASAVDPKGELEVVPLRAKTLNPGATFPGVELPDGVLLTAELARAIDGKPGTEAALLSNDVDGVLSGELVHVAGTMNLNLPGEKKVGLVPLAVAQRLLKLDGRATELVVGVEKFKEATVVAARLREVLGPEYDVKTWEEIAWYIKQQMGRQNFIASFIIVVFTLLMLLGVANTMLLSVFERTREIGTMMAVGVSRRQITLLVLFEALVVGALGALLGSLVGTAVLAFLNAQGIEVRAPASNIPYLLRPAMDLRYLVRTVLVASVGAVVFALYPARRAAKLRPVEALAGQ